MRAIASVTAAVLLVIGIGVGVESTTVSGPPLVTRVIGNFELCGGPAPGTCAPESGQVRFVNVASGASFTAGARSGHYSLNLPRGTYDMAFRGILAGQELHPAGVVKVVAGETTVANAGLFAT